MENIWQMNDLPADTHRKVISLSLSLSIKNFGRDMVTWIILRKGQPTTQK